MKEKNIEQVEALNNRALHFYAETLIPILERNLASELDIKFKVTLNKDELAIYIKYPSSFQNDYVKDSVKLEIGPLAAWTPCETKEISCFIAQEYPQLFERIDFPVLITKSVRTFWEKAVILHQEAPRKGGDVPLRYFRHYKGSYEGLQGTGPVHHHREI